MRRRYAFAPAAVWALVILTLGSIPSLTPPVDLPIDKVAHFSAFAILGGLAAYGLHRVQRRPPIALILVLGAAIGALDEIHQRSVPGRSSDWKDFVADALGVVFGLWLTHRSLERRETQRLQIDSDAGRRTPDADSMQEHRA